MEPSPVCARACAGFHAAVFANHLIISSQSDEVRSKLESYLDKHEVYSRLRQLLTTVGGSAVPSPFLSFL